MKLKPIQALKLIDFLNNLGFDILRQKGSHVFLKHPDGRTTVIPVHKGEEIGRGLLLKILADVKITRKNFIEMLNKK